ncbi:RNA-binding cell elongation regulator Jag/EloR [Natranaerobius thermophilus]|uniref:RNA-binding protein KhpB n=1 Tax=Natranaerobius thermophilus (strain ATCC BAA-1301 / DSM 18059 / JW/NM-WN-LF) TaxID=457570 RepID=B2A471_NATTJ|nr:RNA-binding cell elongation regulator Jag/EloR [Natranaerobius thermophilus]ACB86477.1 single-stranded nucleic acid binding R3H domain protein [Natranaerobius thermophilus JW/NM-WN-LF]
MSQVEVTGKTVEEAVEKGLSELGIERNLADIEVIEEPSSGLLGFIGARPALVKVTKKFDPVELASEYLEGILDRMRIPATVELKAQANQEIHLEIKGKNLGVIIGKRGQTLDSLQFLTNLYLNQKMQGSNHYIILDAENYRDKRKKTLQKLAENLASKVKRTGKKVMLEPMNRYERKIIHTSLQDHDGITTFSEGTEPNRKVVIKLQEK